MYYSKMKEGMTPEYDPKKKLNFWWSIYKKYYKKKKKINNIIILFNIITIQEKHLINKKVSVFFIKLFYIKFKSRPQIILLLIS